MRRDVGSDQGGFVVAFVVLMLFAISVTAATGYLVVASEWRLASFSSGGGEARVAARAALERFVAEQLGAVDDSASYALGGSIAVVSARKVFTRDADTDVYFVRSSATVSDPFTPDVPARRTVGAFAVHHRHPLPAYAAVVVGVDTLRVVGAGEVDGRDLDGPNDCAVGNAPPLIGAIATAVVDEDTPTAIMGSPDTRVWSGGASAVADSIGLRWDILSDPDFPIEFENQLPNYSDLPVDSFPLVRYDGWVSADFQGRGVLLVDGVFDPTNTFVWDGIVIAAEIDDGVEGEIRGLLVVGLDGPNTYSSVDFQMTVRYSSCNVDSAGAVLGYLELLANTVFDVD